MSLNMIVPIARFHESMHARILKSLDLNKAADGMGDRLSMRSPGVVHPDYTWASHVCTCI